MQTFSTVFCLYCKLFLVLGFDFQKNNQNYLNQFLVLKETFFNPVHAKHINNEPFSCLYPFLILLKTLISNNFHNFETLRGSFVVTGSQNPNHNLRLCVSSGIIMIKTCRGFNYLYYDSSRTIFTSCHSLRRHCGTLQNCCHTEGICRVCSQLKLNN